jgi:para-aminobenzoate synthetase component 1
MELILNKEWSGFVHGTTGPDGRDVFYELKIGEIGFFYDLKKLASFISKEKAYFVVVSYDISGDLLGLEIRRSNLPFIIAAEIEGSTERYLRANPYKLKLLGPSMSDSEFINKVKRIKELIADGTIYQVNLTNRFDFEFYGDPVSLFLDFYSRQPVPYSFYFKGEDFFIVSGSMELFLEKRGNIIKSKPIKGTSRTKDALMKSEKDRAENLMITDMMRNDLGKVARDGSVKVTELFQITEYETLFQMHSTVEALTESNFIDIICSTFPPASVTGAPKRKAVEIINILEEHPRSYYCGCAGVINKNGDFSLSVLIRTAIGKSCNLSYYAGCGIVWDSDPEKELEELYLKMKAFYCS